MKKILAAAEAWNKTSPPHKYGVNECNNQARALINSLILKFNCLQLEIVGGTSAGIGYTILGSNHHIVRASPKASSECPVDEKPILLDPYKGPIVKNAAGNVKVWTIEEFKSAYPYNCPDGHKHP